jgi:hypothetical protein
MWWWSFLHAYIIVHGYFGLLAKAQKLQKWAFKIN